MLSSTTAVQPREGSEEGEGVPELLAVLEAEPEALAVKEGAAVMLCVALGGGERRGEAEAVSQKLGVAGAEAGGEKELLGALPLAE